MKLSEPQEYALGAIKRSEDGMTRHDLYCCGVRMPTIRSLIRRNLVHCKPEKRHDREVIVYRDSASVDIDKKTKDSLRELWNSHWSDLPGWMGRAGARLVNRGLATRTGVRTVGVGFRYQVYELTEKGFTLCHELKFLLQGDNIPIRVDGKTRSALDALGEDSSATGGET